MGRMRYAIVVSSPRNYASLFVLTERPPGNELSAVLYCECPRTKAGSRLRWARRRWKKVRRIGLLGALNGVRMRRWYGRMLADRLKCPPLIEACARANVPLIRLTSFADEVARGQLSELDLDVAISLGNGIIPPEFYRIPRFGMLNIHHEVLPEYRGAQTTIWQLHDGSKSTGYSIHEITERIDGGRILLRERVPIQFRRTLRDTVLDTSAEVQVRSIRGLVRVLGDYQWHSERALPNDGKRVYTTPNTRAVLRIYRNFVRLRHEHARSVTQS